MSRLANCFASLKTENRAALVTYITAGDPNYTTSLSLLKSLANAGADVIELGMPFTDPMADGPTIQKAALRALQSGQTLAKTLEMVAAFRKENNSTPIVLMGYFNPIHHYGVVKFTQDAVKAGVDGLIVVDLPTEHDEDLCVPAQKAGIDFIRLVTPTTDEKRLPQVLINSSGFIYYVSVAGITGSASATNDHINQAVQRLHANTSLPICVGFGVRSAEQAKAIAKVADGVVVGSALVSQIEQANGSAENAIKNVTTLCQQLATAIREAR